MQRDQKKPEDDKSRKIEEKVDEKQNQKPTLQNLKPRLEDQFVIIPTEFTIVDQLAFRADTRDPRVADGTFARGFQRKAIRWEDYSKRYTLELLRVKLENGNLIANIPEDDEIKRHKLYLYITNGGIISATKNENGEVKRKLINPRYISAKCFNHLKKALLDTEGTVSLSLADEKKIFEVTGYERHDLDIAYRKRTKQLGMTTEGFKEIVIPLNDIDPTTAVSVTQIFDCAPIFPVGKEYENQTQVWINIVKVHSAFLTYKEQLKRNSNSVFCMEMAMQDIPSGDVICAIKCERYWQPNLLVDPVSFDYKDGMHYQLIGDIVWNPKLKNVENHPQFVQYKQYINHLIQERKDKFIICPIYLNLSDDDKTQIEKGTYPSSLQLKVMSEEEHIVNEFFRAIYVGDFQTFKNILESGVDIQIVNIEDDESKLFPIHLAILHNHIEMVKLLIEHGADINQGAGAGNMSPLDAAISNNKINIAIYLMDQAGIDINRVDNEDYSALDRAIFAKSPELVKALLKKGAEISPITIEIAKKLGNKRINQLLNKVIQNQFSDNLLEAVIRNDTKRIKQLVQEGANINHFYNFNPDNPDDQISLLDLALNTNRFTTVLLLLDLGSKTCAFETYEPVILLHSSLKNENFLKVSAEKNFKAVAHSLHLNYLIIPIEKQTLIMDLINLYARPSVDLAKIPLLKKLLIGLVTDKNFNDIQFSKKEGEIINQNIADKSYLFKLINRYKEISSIPSVELNISVAKKL